MTLSRILGAALLGLTMGSAAQAQSFSLTFDDPALWGSPADGLALDGVSFSDPALTAFILPTSFACSTLLCDGVVQGTVNGTLGMAFGGPMASLQFSLARIGSLASYLTLFDANGSAIETVTLSHTPQSDPDFGEFFGGSYSWAASGTLAHSALLFHEVDPDFDFEGYELDNLSASVAASVPEPLTSALLSVGLVGVAITRRRRRV